METGHHGERRCVGGECTHTCMCVYVDKWMINGCVPQNKCGSWRTDCQSCCSFPIGTRTELRISSLTQRVQPSESFCLSSFSLQIEYSYLYLTPVWIFGIHIYYIMLESENLAFLSPQTHIIFMIRDSKLSSSRIYKQLLKTTVIIRALLYNTKACLSYLIGSGCSLFGLPHHSSTSFSNFKKFKYIVTDFFSYFIHLFFIYAYLGVCTYLSLWTWCRTPYRPEEGVLSPGSGFTGSYELLDEFLDLGSLKEHQVPLTAEPHLQHHPSFLLSNGHSLLLDQICFLLWEYILIYLGY